MRAADNSLRDHVARGRSRRGPAGGAGSRAAQGARNDRRSAPPGRWPGQGEARVTEETYAAFLRCSEEQLQNPELSLERQLHNCRMFAARWGGRIGIVYYEIETGSSSYQQRGTRTSLAAYQLPIPRAGGLHELVRDARTRRGCLTKPQRA